MKLKMEWEEDITMEWTLMKYSKCFSVVDKERRSEEAAVECQEEVEILLFISNELG